MKDLIFETDHTYDNIVNHMIIGTKIYIISGYHQVISEDKMGKYGISGILNKPFEIDELKKIVNA